MIIIIVRVNLKLFTISSFFFIPIIFPFFIPFILMFEYLSFNRNNLCAISNLYTNIHKLQQFYLLELMFKVCFPIFFTYKIERAISKNFVSTKFTSKP